MCDYVLFSLNHFWKCKKDLQCIGYTKKNLEWTGCETIITKQRGSLNLYVVIELYIEISLITNMQDVYFDDESAEVVISSLRLGDDQGRYVCK